MDWSQCSAVDRSPGKLGGKWCFKGTRMPVESLFEHLDTGATIDEFLEWFPGVPAEPFDSNTPAPLRTFLNNAVSDVLAGC